MAGPWEKYQKSAQSSSSGKPWESYQASAQASSDEGAGEALLEGYGQGATLGYLPQFQAKTQPLVDRAVNASIGIASKLGLTDLKALPSEKLAPMEQLTSNGAEYIKARDANSARHKAQAEAHPTAALAGQATGILATSLIPGVFAGRAVKTAGLARGVARGAAIGAAEAAAVNPGDVEGEFNPIQLKERIENAKYGAMFGGGGAAVAKGVTKGIAASKEAAENIAFKSSGAMLKDFRTAASRGKVNDLGRFMLDRVLKHGDTYEDVASKTEALKQAAGKEIGKTYAGVLEQVSDPKLWDSLPAAQKSALAMTGFKPVAQKGEVMKTVGEALGDSPNRKVAMNYLDEYLADLGEKYGDDLDIVSANKIKGDIDKAINYSKRMQDLPEKQEALFALRNHIRDQIESHIDVLDNIVGGNRVKDLRAANRTFGAASELEGIAFDRVQRENANRFFSLGDRVTGAAGIAGGAASGAVLGGDLESTLKGAALGLAGAGASRMTRRYGAVGAAKTLDSLSKRPGLAMVPGSVASSASKVAMTPENRPVESGETSPHLLTEVGESEAPISAASAKPLKGREKWAADGARKLQEHGGVDDLDSSDPKIQGLLIQASDFKPGSKAMNRVLEQIKAKQKGSK